MVLKDSQSIRCIQYIRSECHKWAGLRACSTSEGRAGLPAKVGRSTANCVRALTAPSKTEISASAMFQRDG